MINLKLKMHTCTVNYRKMDQYKLEFKFGMKHKLRQGFKVGIFFRPGV